MDAVRREGGAHRGDAVVRPAEAAGEADSAAEAVVDSAVGVGGEVRRGGVGGSKKKSAESIAVDVQRLVDGAHSHRSKKDACRMLRVGVPAFTATVDAQRAVFCSIM